MLARRRRCRRSVVAEDRDDDRQWKWRLPCSKWCRDRWKTTILGCMSSGIVLTVRLYLDSSPPAYLIHAIIVFLDMILIHCFTHSKWLSVSGESLTVVFFLAFHFTKETIYELLETTLIAVLCSFHLIGSRNKHKENEEELQQGMENIRRQSMMVLKRGGLEGIDDAELGDLIKEEEETGNDASWLVRHKDPECRRRVLGCGERFFEYFLDGSAGVMYTSFLGLILSQLLTYGDSSSK